MNPHKDIMVFQENPVLEIPEGDADKVISIQKVLNFVIVHELYWLVAIG